MTPLVVAWLLLLGAAAGVMGTLTVQWWQQRGRWRRIELDPYTERLRALDRSSDTAYRRPPTDDEYLMAQLRKANREGLL